MQRELAEGKMHIKEQNRTTAHLKTELRFSAHLKSKLIAQRET